MCARLDTLTFYRNELANLFIRELLTNHDKTAFKCILS